MNQPLLLRARTVLDMFHQAFDTPRELAMREVVTRKEHGLMADWLRNLEMLVRRILWIMAAMLEVEPAPKRPKRPRQRGWHFAWADLPGTWRASFRVIEHARYAKRRSNGVRREEPRFRKQFITSWRLALRLEAVTRVLAKPANAAYRLARAVARRRAAKNNAPSTAILRPWSFAAETRTLGKHAVSEGMFAADEPSEDAFLALMGPPEPG